MKHYQLTVHGCTLTSENPSSKTGDRQKDHECDRADSKTMVGVVYPIQANWLPIYFDSETSHQLLRNPELLPNVIAGTEVPLKA
jgi:hypothetical protein